MRRFILLAAFVLLVVGGGSLIGLTARPDAWYAALHKPPFNPPNWIFAPVWTLLYILVAVAGWRVFLRDWRSASMALWVAQLAANFLWSPAFFGAHSPGLALGIVIALLVLIASFIATTYANDRVAAWLFVPYGLWVAFATLLNASIVILN
jgi:tryptophan-rich sensory protein